MKIVRTFKHDPHPSIIPFHSFIITPSYALVTMEYLPRLMPVEVCESKARVWFESLVSGVAFLHARGVVHNDIKCVTFVNSDSRSHLQTTPNIVDPPTFSCPDRTPPSSSTLASQKSTMSTLSLLSSRILRMVPPSISLPNAHVDIYTTLANPTFGLLVLLSLKS